MSTRHSERPVPGHGSTTRYHRGCRCRPCRRAKSAYNVRHRRETRAGRPYLVDALEAREHLERLLEAGYTLRGVAGLAGLNFRTVQALASGRRAKLTLAVADSILAVALDQQPAAGSHLVPADCARELLEAMRVAGIPRKEISAALRLSPQSDPAPGAAHVTMRTYRRLVVLYRLLARRGVVPVRPELEERWA